MNNKEKVESIILSIIGSAAYDGIKTAVKFISAGVPVALLTFSSPQQVVETPKKETTLTAVYAEQDQVFIQRPSPRFLMPPTNTLFTTTSSTLSVVSGDQVMARGF